MSLRFIYLGLIVEVGKHAAHADFLAEQVLYEAQLEAQSLREAARGKDSVYRARSSGVTLLAYWRVGPYAITVDVMWAAARMRTPRAPR